MKKETIILKLKIKRKKLGATGFRPLTAQQGGGGAWPRESK
jgi:hypothetical protein